MGFKVHTRYATWLELLLIALLVPGTSFLGHLCGIVAGIAYVEIPIIAPFLRYMIPWGPKRPSYTYHSGTTSGYAARDTARGTGRQSRGPRYTSSRGTTGSARAAPVSQKGEDCPCYDSTIGGWSREARGRSRVV